MVSDLIRIGVIVVKDDPVEIPKWLQPDEILRPHLKRYHLQHSIGREASFRLEKRHGGRDLRYRIQDPRLIEIERFIRDGDGHLARLDAVKEDHQAFWKLQARAYRWCSDVGLYIFSNVNQAAGDKMVRETHTFDWRASGAANAEDRWLREIERRLELLKGIRDILVATRDGTKLPALPSALRTQGTPPWTARGTSP